MRPPAWRGRRCRRWHPRELPTEPSETDHSREPHRPALWTTALARAGPTGAPEPDADGNEVGVEANLGGTGVVLDFPFTTVDFWDTWDGLHDGWQLRTGERESGLDEA